MLILGPPHATLAVELRAQRRSALSKPGAIDDRSAGTQPVDPTRLMPPTAVRVEGGFG